MRELAQDLWVEDRRFRIAGLEVGTRMTVVRLADGGLWLHSPVHLDPELKKALDELGPVRFAVAPNRYHHLAVADVRTAYPHAAIYAAPGLPERRPKLGFDAVLGDTAPPEWAGQIDQLFFPFVSILNEVLFCHRASRTLVMTDLSANFRGGEPWLTRVFWRALDGYGKFGPSRIERWLMRERPAARAALERVLAWDFDRVIVSHGEILERGGRDALRRGYHWLLD